MKVFAINLAASLLAFICGLVTASTWNSNSQTPKNPEPVVIESCPKTIDESTPAVPIPTPSPQVVFGKGRLRIVSEEINLKSERLQYDVHVSYPQIVGSNDLAIQKLNRRLKGLVTEQYEGILHPTRADLKYYREKWPEVFNSIRVDYSVSLANDSVLSIAFTLNYYGIGAGTSVEDIFAVNYDLVAKKELKLADIFKPNSNYLEFIGRYCRDELSEVEALSFFSAEKLSPVAKNFGNWNVTANGISFNFPECEILSCSQGNQSVEIPFSELKLLSSNSSVKQALSE